MRFSAAILGCCVIGLLSVCGCRGAADDASTGREADRVARDSVGGGVGDRRVAVAAGGEGRAVRAPNQEHLSGIAIVAGMDCEFYLTDALGRRTGLDPAWEKPLGEIPRSAYFDEAIEDPEGDGRMEHKHLEIMSPETGEYRLTIIAVAGAECDIYIRMYDAAGEPKAIDLENIPVAPGTARHYILMFDKSSASRCTLAAVDENAGK